MIEYVPEASFQEELRHSMERSPKHHIIINLAAIIKDDVLES